VKLIQAAALAAALVPLGSIAMEGASISCGFSGASNNSFSGCTGGGSTQTFDFNQTPSAADDYKVILTFFGMDQAFNMTVTDHTLSHAAFLAREGLAGSYDCVNVVDPTSGDPCREFEFESSTGQAEWDSFSFDFVWDYDSENSGYPNGTDPPGDDPGDIRILQNKGLPQAGLFTIDMCLEALTDSAFTPCSYQASAVDPRIGSGNTDFSTAVIATETTVPEPSSLILLCAGSALLYRRRRQSKAA
jgi:hypothetical protein